MASLKTRLLYGIVIGTAVLLAGFSAIIYTMTRRALTHHFDRSLLTTAKLLAAVVENEHSDEEHDGEEHDRNVDEETEEDATEPEGELEFEFDVRMTPEFSNLNGGGYYQFWSHDETVVARSPSLGPKDLPHSEDVLATPTYQEYVLPDGKPGRAIYLKFLPRTGEEDSALESASDADSVTLALARDASDLHAHLSYLKLVLLAASVVIVLLSTGVALVVARMALRPIDTLAQEITSVHEDKLAYRFSTTNCSLELQPICECLNRLLERLESSFDRRRRFNADVAHELRTPLAGIRSSIEVSLSRDRNPRDYKAALTNCLKIATSMQKMIDTLLSLARIDARQVAAQFESISLRDMAEDLWPRFGDKAYDKKVNFENNIPPDISCTSDKDHLRMIVSNVLDNAVEYCNPGGRIWTTAERSTDSIILSISNTGCRLTQDDVSHVFDSFWRSDTSRTDTGRHCGVGLAVVKKLADVLNVKVEAQVESEIFTIRLSLPATLLS